MVWKVDIYAFNPCLNIQVFIVLMQIENWSGLCDVTNSLCDLIANIFIHFLKLI